MEKERHERFQFCVCLFLVFGIIGGPLTIVGLKEMEEVEVTQGLLFQKSFDVLNYTASSPECNPAPPVQHGPAPLAPLAPLANTPLPTINYILYYSFRFNLSDGSQKEGNSCGIESSYILFNCTNTGIHRKLESTASPGLSTCFRLVSGSLNSWNDTVLNTTRTLYVNKHNSNIFFTLDDGWGKIKFGVGIVFSCLAIVCLCATLASLGLFCSRKGNGTLPVLQTRGYDYEPISLSGQ